MNEEEYNIQKQNINSQFDQLLEEYTNNQINLDNDYNDQIDSLDKQIEVNDQEYVAYRTTGEQNIEEVEQFLNKREIIDKSKHINKVGNLYHQELNNYRDVTRNLVQDKEDTTHTYQNNKEQQEDDYSTNYHNLTLKLEQLEDDYLDGEQKRN